PRPDFASLEIARLDGDGPVPFGERSLGHVEPELGLAGLGVEPVTGEAVVGQDRSHVAVELDRGVVRGTTDDREKEQREEGILHGLASFALAVGLWAERRLGSRYGRRGQAFL